VLTTRVALPEALKGFFAGLVVEPHNATTLSGLRLFLVRVKHTPGVPSNGSQRWPLPFLVLASSIEKAVHYTTEDIRKNLPARGEGLDFEFNTVPFDPPQVFSQYPKAFSYFRLSVPTGQVEAVPDKG
jgi:hypothetical protein